MYVSVGYLLLVILFLLLFVCW